MSTNSNTGSSSAATFTYGDAQFFRIVQSLFSPSFVFGASVLLGSYDDEEPPYVPAEHVYVDVTSTVRV
jgi:hypothetical protein